MWNEKTKQLVADGKLVVIGIVQEQHAERARLYKQWKQYEFPIVQDSFTELGLGVVPVIMLIDEYGYVQTARPHIRHLESFIASKTKVPAKPAPILDPKKRTAYALSQPEVAEGSLQQGKQSMLVGDALIRQVSAQKTIDFATFNDGHQSSPLHDAINHYRQSERILAKEKSELLGALYFRQGVAFRMLYDKMPEGQKDIADFDLAAEYWSKALEQNPNQYIWRRRIQQYGPRQTKPYPFYDWVQQAQTEIAERGESPVRLTVPLTEAETAAPSRNFTSAKKTTNPDPQGRINLDDNDLVRFHATVVPAIVKPGETVRVHLQFAAGNGKWNNEADNMVVWINESKSGASEKSLMEFPNAIEAASNETRKFEFEYQTAKDASGNLELSGFALFNACKSANGQCLYLRKEFRVPIVIKP